MSNERTHDCGTLSDSHIGETVTLCGWVHTRRDHGGLIFVDLWDKYGMTQVVLNPQIDQLAHEHAQSIRGNFVIAVTGKVRARPDDMVNTKMKTGNIEVYVDELHILNPSETPPISPWEPQDTSEALRLKYRFLDLRGPVLQRNLRNPSVDQEYPGRGTGLSGAQSAQPAKVLCPAPVATVVQTDSHGLGHGPIFPDR